MAFLSQLSLEHPHTRAAVTTSIAKKAIVLENVTKSFGDHTAVANLNLQIEHGEFISIIGPSGCGKTTTLLLIAGLDKPTNGAIYIDGRLVNDVKPWKRHTPLVWQNFALFPHLDVRRNVEFGLRMRRMGKQARRAKVDQVLELLGISHLGGRSIAGLSGGEQQRIGLARAIVTDPKILLLDEPLSSLDAHLRIRMQSELRALHEKLGITFVFVTHDQSEALAMADRIVVMESGQIQQVGTPQEVYREPANRFVADFVGTNNILSGRVEEASTERARIATPVGNFSVAEPGRYLRPQERASFLVRADRVYLSTGPEQYDNQITGTLRGEKYIGSRVIFVVELSDGSEFLIERGEDEIADRRPELGGEVTAGWKTSDTYLLPGEEGESGKGTEMGQERELTEDQSLTKGDFHE